MRVTVSNLSVSQDLYQLINEEIMPGTGVEASHFWSSMERLLQDFMPRNKALLGKRDELQQQIDAWHLSHPAPIDMAEYKQFLSQIGYIVPKGEAFKIDVKNVDEEIAEIAGPQLVVPVSNARYALNATNARWGSLYDALYGTDVIDEAEGKERGSEYNAKRGQAVVDYANDFLNQYLPLEQGGYQDITDFKIQGGQWLVTLSNGRSTQLQNAKAFAGYKGSVDAPTVVLLKHNHLHIELHFDRNHRIGSQSPSGLKDVVLESAISVIQDCEDSVAAVDSEDKVGVYRNWLGLMKGDLTANIDKNGTAFVRRLNEDHHYTSPTGNDLTLPGRSMLLVRNVGHLMTNSAITTANGDEIPEGIMDAMVTALAAMHDVKNKRLNSRKGSIYIVKPKMHGPEEVAFSVDLFARVEQILGLPEYTLKIGIMDEERRTSVNLAECIRLAKSRLIFINTGFLDRTGDEIHTSMLAGPMIRKGEIKNAKWIAAYENNNVDTGLACGLQGHAQIGKGMWAMPDEMQAMMATKASHPKSGANTAWVPSPTAATLHAIHYHEVDVFAEQAKLKNRIPAAIDDILTIPLAPNTDWSAADIQNEVENNCQSTLGYVVRWIDQGVGCSKVLDINNVALMEDRATLRISSQHLANWIDHGIVSEAEVLATLKRMAKVVDEQNSDDPLYQAMAPEFNGVAFQAACDLIFNGKQEANGYTEPPLHRRRIERKKQNN